MDAARNLYAALGTVEACVGYEAFGYEVSLGEMPVSLPKERVVLPAHAKRAPEDLARECRGAFPGKRVCVFLPGSAFDARGTRAGRGGGWYDRFLAAVPKSWLRVGVCAAEQFSAQMLERQPWDEPVDFVCIKEADGWRVTETRARQA